MIDDAGSTKKQRGIPFKKGVSGNPSGRRKLPEELKQIRDSTLERAILLLHDKLHDEIWCKKASDRDLLSYMEAAFDRLGLPKQSNVAHSGALDLELMMDAKNKSHPPAI
jgi:hypothetical protein